MLDSFDICVQWKKWLISQFGRNKPFLFQLEDPAWYEWKIEGTERFVGEFTSNEERFKIFNKPNPLIIFLCRKIAYYLAVSPYISVYDTPKQKDTLYSYTKLLGQYIRQQKTPVYIKKQIISYTKKHHKHLKNNTFCKAKIAYMKKLLANKKRTIRSKINLMVTEKRVNSNTDDDVFVTFKTPIYFAHNIAESALCLQKSINSRILPTWRLFDLVAHNNGTIFDSLLENATIDLLHTLSNIIDFINSKMYIKLIVVNPPTCTCHVKCKGYKTRNIVDIFDNTVLQSISEITRCKLCRFSPNVYNTSAKKSRRNLCHQNIANPVCSLHNTPTMEKVGIYEANIDKTGAYYHKHVFYVTNSINIVATLMGKKKAGPKFRMYGLCYGGSRLCYNKVVVYVADSKNKCSISSSTSLYDKFICTECITHRVKCNDFLIGTGFEDKDSCVGDILKRITGPPTRAQVETFIGNMCDGCKMKILCPHVVINLRNYAFSVSNVLKVKHYSRLLIIQFIQGIIKENLQ